MPQFTDLIVLYFAVIGVVSAILTVVDKRASKKRKRRISEKTLLLLGLAGGALPMFTTMKLIRHKTKHKKFMIALPLEIVLHIIIILAVFVL